MRTFRGAAVVAPQVAHLKSPRFDSQLNLTNKPMETGEVRYLDRRRL
jgi:hypothetical protein